jgi:hypothetical protein
MCGIEKLLSAVSFADPLAVEPGDSLLVMSDEPGSIAQGPQESLVVDHQQQKKRKGEHKKEEALRMKLHHPSADQNRKDDHGQLRRNKGSIARTMLKLIFSKSVQP